MYPIYGFTDALKQTAFILSFHFHALATTYGNEIESLALSDSGQIGFHPPFGIERQQIISQGENPVAESYSILAHGDSTEPKNGAIKKPQDQNQPDGEYCGVFWPLFDDGMNEKRQHHTERDQHNGILDKEGFDDEYL